MSAIENYLKSCPELVCFCSQNGWIDNQSLHCTIVMEAANEAFVEVEFDELLMTGPGHSVERVTCCGQLHLYLDSFGHVIRARVL